MNALDLKDRKLLHAIDLDARKGSLALAKQIGLSQEGTHYRLTRLEKKGVISGYMTLLNFAKLGFTGYSVYARFHNIQANQREDIFSQLCEYDHIFWVGEFGRKI